MKLNKNHTTLHKLKHNIVQLNEIIAKVKVILVSTTKIADHAGCQWYTVLLKDVTRWQYCL